MLFNKELKSLVENHNEEHAFYRDFTSSNVLSMHVELKFKLSLNLKLLN